MPDAFKLIITGLDPSDFSKVLENLPDKLMTNLWLGFSRYAKKHLLQRMKNRLSQATSPVQRSTPGPDGVPSGGGGYGVPTNSSKYSEWKKSRLNLPLVGRLSSRELVATGYLVDSLDILKAEKQINGFNLEIGHRPGPRPVAKAFSDNPRGSGAADVSGVVENTQLAQWIEDSKYAFWVTEFEDVQRDVIPLFMHILKLTIKQLWAEYVKVKTGA